MSGLQSAEQGHQHKVVVRVDLVQSDEAEIDPPPVEIGLQQGMVGVGVIVKDYGVPAEQSHHI